MAELQAVPASKNLYAFWRAILVDNMLTTNWLLEATSPLLQSECVKRHVSDQSMTSLLDSTVPNWIIKSAQRSWFHAFRAELQKLSSDISSFLLGHILQIHCKSKTSWQLNVQLPVLCKRNWHSITKKFLSNAATRAHTATTIYSTLDSPKYWHTCTYRAVSACLGIMVLTDKWWHWQGSFGIILSILTLNAPLYLFSAYSNKFCQRV